MEHYIVKVELIGIICPVISTEQFAEAMVLEHALAGLLLHDRGPVIDIKHLFGCTFACLLFLLLIFRMNAFKKKKKKEEEAESAWGLGQRKGSKEAHLIPARGGETSGLQRVAEPFLCEIFVNSF